MTKRETKICTACGIEKNASYFYKMRDGYGYGYQPNSKCKRCHKGDTKTCKVCGVEKNVMSFYKSRTGDGYRARCRRCHKEAYEYNDKNRERSIDRLCEWVRNNGG